MSLRQLLPFDRYASRARSSSDISCAVFVEARRIAEKHLLRLSLSLLFRDF